MKRIVFSVLAAMALAPSGAVALGATDPLPMLDMSPEGIADANREAAAIIAAAKAEDVFDVVPLRGIAGIILRHKASGFVCDFERHQARNAVVVYPNPVRGDEVSCSTMTLIGTRTTIISRDSRTDDVAIAKAARSIQGSNPRAVPAPEPRIQHWSAGSGGLPSPKRVRFLIDDRLEEVILGHVDGWLVEDWFIAPRDLAESDTIDSHWYQTAATVRAKSAAPPR